MWLAKRDYVMFLSTSTNYVPLTHSNFNGSTYSSICGKVSIATSYTIVNQLPQTIAGSGSRYTRLYLSQHHREGRHCVPLYHLFTQPSLTTHTQVPTQRKEEVVSHGGTIIYNTLLLKRSGPTFLALRGQVRSIHVH